MRIAIFFVAFVSALLVGLSAQPIWTDVSPASGPGARWAASLVYDVARQRILLFGGGGRPAYYNDTWEWDGTSWTRRTPSVSPPARSAAMAYDIARQRTVLFGGVGDNNVWYNDTWEWDGHNWSKRSPRTNPPGPTARLAYDSVRRKVVLYTAGTANETWEWDGVDWTRRTSRVVPPVRGAPSELAYDITRGRTVLFGGRNQGTVLNDTWGWDGGNWIPHAPATSAGRRGGAAMAYDTTREKTVMFGGHLYYPLGAYAQDTWEWDGADWQQILSVGPPSRGAHTMAYDRSRGVIVMFGGHDNFLLYSDTWEYRIAPTISGTGTPRPGSQMALTLQAAGDLGYVYQVGSSLGNGPIPIGNRLLHLSPDGLLDISVGGRWPNVFLGYRGTMSSSGTATATIVIPNLPFLVGQRVHTAFVTLSAIAPQGIRSVSDTFSFSITR